MLCVEKKVLQVTDVTFMLELGFASLFICIIFILFHFLGISCQNQQLSPNSWKTEQSLFTMKIGGNIQKF